MKKFTLFAIVLMLAACSSAPSEEDIQKAIEKTQTYNQTATALVDVEPIEITTLVPPIAYTQVQPTIEPTESEVEDTPTAQPSSTPERSIEELRENVRQETIKMFESEVWSSQIEMVNLVRFDFGVWEIELQTVWASQDSQPEVSWAIVNVLTFVYEQLSPRQRMNLTGSEELTLVLTTYSTDGGYRYKSETDFDTMMKIKNRSISYEEWILLANAGFR